MGLKIKRTPGQGVIIGRNSTVITVELLDGNAVILDVAGEPRRLEKGSSLALEKGRIQMSLEAVDRAYGRVLFDFVQKGEEKNWLRIVRAEKYS